MLYIGLWWPITLLLLDILAMRQTAYDVQGRHKSSLSMDANALCSLTFAMAGIVGASSHELCNRILLFSVLGCVAFVMPSAHSETNSSAFIALDALKKAILSFATGLLLVGVLLAVSDKGVGLVLR